MPFMENLKNVVFEDDRKHRRQQIVPLLTDLADRGLKPDEIDQVANQFILTGKMDLPARRERGVPYAPGTTDEVKLRKKAKQLYSYDPQAGLFLKGPREDDNTDIEVQRMLPEKGIGYDIKIDKYTGDEKSRVPNKEGKNRYIYVGINPNGGRGGGGKDSPEVALAKDTIRKYQTMVGKNLEPPAEFMDSVRSAADLLDLELEQVEQDPGLLDAAQDFAADATEAIPGVPDVPRPKPKFGGAAVRFKPKGGKPLTAEKAQEFMQQAVRALGPNAKPGAVKAKARELAKQANYTF